VDGRYGGIRSLLVFFFCFSGLPKSPPNAASDLKVSQRSDPLLVTLGLEISHVSFGDEIDADETKRYIN